MKGPVTVDVTVREHFSSMGRTMSYAFGSKAERQDVAYGVPLTELVGDMGEGSICRVTVQVLKRKRPRKNPWARP